MMREKLSYILCLPVIAGLILGAFYLPELLFRMEDHTRLSDLQTGVREGADLTVLMGNYEQSIEKRLTNLAEGLAAGTDYFVSLTEENTDMEVLGLDYFEVLEQAYQEERIPWHVYEQVYSIYEKEERRYLIYDNGADGGVCFDLWYQKLYSGQDTIIELLADAETGELYYVRTTELAYENAYTENAYTDAQADIGLTINVLWEEWYRIFWPYYGLQLFQVKSVVETADLSGAILCLGSESAPIEFIMEEDVSTGQCVIGFSAFETLIPELRG